MARWVNQRWDERLADGTNPRVETKWNIVGTPPADPAYTILQARLDLLATVPASFANLPMTELTIDRLGGSGLFTADVVYGLRQVPEDGKFDFTMDSRPEAVRAFVALSTVASYPAPGITDATTFNNFAVPNNDKEPQGADIYRPVKTYNVSVWWSLNRFVIGQADANYRSLQAYVDLIDALDGCVNSTTFTFSARGLTFTFLPGECLLSGSRLSQQGADLWQIDFELKKKKSYIDPNLSAYHGSSVTVDGWDRPEYESVPTADETAHRLGIKPVSGRILRDYFRDDLNKLKVPTP